MFAWLRSVREDLMMRAFKLVRSAAFSFLASVLLMNSLETTVNAALPMSAFFGHICISVSDLAEDLNFLARKDLAERVSSAVRVKVEAAEPDGKRMVRTEPDCMKADQPGFDRQLTLKLSVKRQRVKLDGRDWNVVVAGGVSANGVIPDGWMQPVLIVQQESVADDSIVDALVEFVDRSVIASMRRR